MEGKCEYKWQLTRMEFLPEAYKFVFRKIQHHMWCFAGDDDCDMMETHDGLIDLFEFDAVSSKHVLEVTGQDVTAFCDELLKNAKTHTGGWRGELNCVIVSKLG
jgi:DNA-binding ferritin-like protein (Dps family)